MSRYDRQSKDLEDRQSSRGFRKFDQSAKNLNNRGRTAANWDQAGDGDDYSKWESASKSNATTRMDMGDYGRAEDLDDNELDTAGEALGWEDDEDLEDLDEDLDEEPDDITTGQSLKGRGVNNWKSSGEDRDLNNSKRRAMRNRSSTTDLEQDFDSDYDKSGRTTWQEDDVDDGKGNRFAGPRPFSSRSNR